MNESLQRTVIEESRKAADIRQKTGYWPIIGSSFVDISTFDCWLLDNDTAQHQLAELSRQPDLRAAAVHLAWASACASAEYGTLEFDVEIKPSAALAYDCIAALPVDAIDSAAQFRWELDTAASFGQYSRVARLLRAWHDRGMPTEYLSIGIRMLYLPIDPQFEAGPIYSGVWDPALEPTELRESRGRAYLLYSLIAWADTMTLAAIRTAGTLDTMASLSDKVDRQQVRELRHWVDLAKDAGLSSDPVICAVSAWTTYALGLLDGGTDDLRRAGKLFEHLPSISADQQLISGLEVRRWHAASIAYQDAGALDDAARTARLFAEADQKERRAAWRRVAEISIQSGNLKAALDALLNSVAAEDGDDDWRDRLIVELGSEQVRGDALVRALTNAADATPFKTQGQALVCWMLPWYPRLCEKAQQGSVPSSGGNSFTSFVSSYAAWTLPRPWTEERRPPPLGKPQSRFSTSAHTETPPHAIAAKISWAVVESCGASSCIDSGRK